MSNETIIEEENYYNLVKKTEAIWICAWHMFITSGYILGTVLILILTAFFVRIGYSMLTGEL